MKEHIKAIKQQLRYALDEIQQNVDPDKNLLCDWIHGSLSRIESIEKLDDPFCNQTLEQKKKTLEWELIKVKQEIDEKELKIKLKEAVKSKEEAERLYYKPHENLPPYYKTPQQIENEATAKRLDELEERISKLEEKEQNKIRGYQCGRCGSIFKEKIGHICNTGYRKRGFNWIPLY